MDYLKYVDVDKLVKDFAPKNCSDDVYRIFTRYATNKIDEKIKDVVEILKDTPYINSILRDTLKKIEVTKELLKFRYVILYVDHLDFDSGADFLCGVEGGKTLAEIEEEVGIHKNRYYKIYDLYEGVIVHENIPEDLKYILKIEQEV